MEKRLPMQMKNVFARSALAGKTLKKLNLGLHKLFMRSKILLLADGWPSIYLLLKIICLILKVMNFTSKADISQKFYNDPMLVSTKNNVMKVPNFIKNDRYG